MVQKEKIALLLTPAFIIFLSSNFVNAGNMLFNLLFSRWMGPELFSDLALILTLKLSILSVLNALQMLATEKTASANVEDRGGIQASYAWLNKVTTIALFVALPVFVFLAFSDHVADFFGLGSDKLMPIFMFGIPIYLPLALWRGFAQGRVDMWRMVASANVEMLIRLVGGAVFYALGFGVEGVVAAFVLALWGAWWFAKPSANLEKIQMPLSKSLPWRHSLPWAAMQFGIVLMLDGDVIIAKTLWSATDAGYIAAISLVQRIIFFASFALTSVLIPQVIEEAKLGSSGFSKLPPVIGLFLLSTVPVLTALAFFPEMATNILFGSKFDDIAPSLLNAGIVAAFATINYFIISFALAHKLYVMAYLFAACSILQVVVLRTTMIAGETLHDVIVVKLWVQFAFLIVFSLVMAYKFFNKTKLRKG